jgi:hypothetical protein
MSTGKWVLLVIVAVIAAVVIRNATKGPVNLHGAPNVDGLTLDVAKKVLHRRGFTADVHSDGLFGVFVPSHFIVCDEHPPNGRLVLLDVAKHGC